MDNVPYIQDTAQVAMVLHIVLEEVVDTQSILLMHTALLVLEQKHHRWPDESRFLLATETNSQTAPHNKIKINKKFKNCRN